MFEKLSDRYKKIFERQSPTISCNKYFIEDAAAPGFFDGYFIIKNTGGGILEGDVFASSSFVKLSNTIIEGNDLIIEYEIDLRHMLPGEVFESRIVFTTSGGQLVIPVKIDIKPYGIKCGRFKVHTLKDFEACARALPEEAAEVFVTPEFEEWLCNSKCEHMEFYRILAGGRVGIKEIDSFLAACGIKNKAAVRALEDSVSFFLPEDEAEKTELIKLKSDSWGVFEYTVKTLGNAPWLRISSYTITDRDFVNGELDFAVYLKNDGADFVKVYETIIFESPQDTFRTEVAAKRSKPFTVSLSRLSYKNEDTGFLIVENHTGTNTMLEVSSAESFVRFKSAKYLIQESTEIPFEIKVNSFLNLGIGRKPINVSEITCRAVVDGRAYRERLTVKAGSL